MPRTPISLFAPVALALALAPLHAQQPPAPGVSPADGAVKSAPGVRLAVDKTGAFRLDDRPVTGDAAVEELRGLARANPGMGVIIVPDHGVNHDFVMRAIELVKSAGIQRVAMGTPRAATAPVSPVAPAPVKPAVTVPDLTELSSAPDSDALLRLVQIADGEVPGITDPAERALVRATLDKLGAKPDKAKAILAEHASNLAEIRNKVPETIFLTGLALCKTDAEVVRFARESYADADKLADPSLRRTVRFTLAKLEDKPGEARAILKDHLKAVGARFYSAANASFEANDARGALESVQIAVRCDPANAKARLLFANILHSMGDTGPAIQTLGAGLQYIEPASPVTAGYLDRYFQLLESREDDATVITDAGTLLSKEGFTDAAREMLAMHLATCLYFTNNNDAALRVIAKHELNKRVQGRLLEAKCLFDGRRTEAATRSLEQSSGSFQGLERDAVLSQLQRFWTELGRDSLALDVAEQRIREFPDRSSPRVHRLWIYVRSGDKTQFNKESRDVLEQYSQDQGAMLALANLAADRGLPDLASECFTRARMYDFNRPLFGLLLLESYINARQYRDALQAHTNLTSLDKSMFKGQEASANALLAAADTGAAGNAASKDEAAALKDEAARHLDVFLKAKGLQPEAYISAARLLRRSGDTGAALKILQAGRAAQPWDNQIRADLLAARILDGDTTVAGAPGVAPVVDPTIDSELFAIAKGRRVDPSLWDTVGFWLQTEARLPLERLKPLQDLVARMARPDLAKDSVRD